MSRIIVENVVNRNDYPGEILFVDKHGNVAVAERKQKMSSEEIRAKQAARKATHQLKMAKLEPYKQSMITAHNTVKKKPSIENVKARDQAAKEYERMGGRVPSYIRRVMG